MGQVLRGSATTNEAIRRAIQARQESVGAVAKRHGVSATPIHESARQMVRDIAVSEEGRTSRRERKGAFNLVGLLVPTAAPRGALAISGLLKSMSAG